MARVDYVCHALLKLGKPGPVDARSITARLVAVPPEQLDTRLLDAANDAR